MRCSRRLQQRWCWRWHLAASDGDRGALYAEFKLSSCGALCLAPVAALTAAISKCGLDQQSSVGHAEVVVSKWPVAGFHGVSTLAQDHPDPLLLLLWLTPVCSTACLSAAPGHGGAGRWPPTRWRLAADTALAVPASKPKAANAHVHVPWLQTRK